jgi:hypothetical protein
MVRVLGWMVLLARSDAAKEAAILVLVLGVKVAASTVWEILHEAGIDPAPERGRGVVLLACDFFEAVTLSGTRTNSVMERWLQTCRRELLDRTLVAAPDQIASLHIRRRDRLGGVLHEYHHAA